MGETLEMLVDMDIRVDGGKTLDHGYWCRIDHPYSSRPILGIGSTPEYAVSVCMMELSRHNRSIVGRISSQLVLAVRMCVFGS